MMTKREEFSDWLKQELAQRGWDQAELARQSHITPGQISHLLAGDRSAGPNACRKLARVFHLPPEEVFRRAGLLPRASESSEEFERLTHYFRLMKPSDQKRLIMIARTFAESNDTE